MTKSRSFRYGYNAGDLVSSALSGWLFMNLVYLIVTIASGEGLETLHSGVQTYMRNFLTVAVFASVRFRVLLMTGKEPHRNQKPMFHFRYRKELSMTAGDLCLLSSR